MRVSCANKFVPMVKAAAAPPAFLRKLRREEEDFIVDSLIC